MINAARAALADVPVPVFDSFVSDEELQDTYILLISPLPNEGDESPLSGSPSQADLIVRAVGVSADQVRALLSEVRSRLRGLHVASDWQRFAFQWVGSPRPIQVDGQSKNRLGTFPTYLDDEFVVYIEQI
ncbi:hypothetical protein [Flaviflexus equikiangi]|uniref:Uncharacterized protein n=1 Tax=Flaviflexus equikiangi TaxID=2758573 RepID=A0ABS2TCG7_9ACTO|nr:hypothetical protein [Flaviflexus equikiangi]MBM9432340.1 hypothetical protein [Flaviflexus equikiangi]